jgi:hypothetical protein
LLIDQVTFLEQSFSVQQLNMVLVVTDQSLIIQHLEMSAKGLRGDIDNGGQILFGQSNEAIVESRVSI